VTRAAFVFQNPRRQLLDEVRAGREPDTILLGLNHLDAFDVDARLHDPPKGGGPLFRLAWTAREVPLPWRLGGAEVAFSPLANLFPLAARVRGGPPVVVANYGLNTIYDRSTRARRRLLAANLRAAAGVVCLGSAQRDGIVGRAGLDPARVHVILLGADVDWFTPAPAPADGYVLTVGKDLARDLATFAAGVAGLDARVEVVAHPRNLADVSFPVNVRARSGVSMSELRDLYAGASCVVVPQRADGYPFGSEGGGLTTICEAMAMGRPIIATERAALRDYLDDDELVPPGDPEALRSAIEAVLGSDTVAAERAARSRRRAEERHSTRRFAASLAPILRAAASLR
jgi:glycosyltransferase involved in cell wall biosynthesis